MEMVSPLVLCKILGLFLKTFNAGLNYSVLNREYLKKSIHMQLSQKQKHFLNLFLYFSNAE